MSVRKVTFNPNKLSSSSGDTMPKKSILKMTSKSDHSNHSDEANDSDDENQWEDIYNGHDQDEEKNQEDDKIQEIINNFKFFNAQSEDENTEDDKNDEIEIKDTKTDEGLDPYEAIEIVNLFLKKQNELKQTVGASMFHNVDFKDPSSTNDQMELFYEYMNEYQVLSNINLDHVDIYDEDTYQKQDIDCDIEVNTYALVQQHTNKLYYLSMSYISLLYCALDNLKNKDDWNIIKL